MARSTCAPDKYEYRPRPGESVWLVFDLSNGHPGGGGACQYVWWFRSKRHAEAFLRRRAKDRRVGAMRRKHYSRPMKYRADGR